jgi:peptide deformylase
MKLDFTYLGHPILRTKAAPIHTIDHAILQLIEHMKHTVELHRGLGLAAPQVGASVALFVACFPENSEGSPVPGTPRVFINPKLEDHSQERWSAEEGCLSIPKVYAPVSRPISVTITAQNELGEWHTERLSGWNAKIVLHENDHLNGVLFIDRIEQKDKKRVLSDLSRIKKHFQHHNEQVKGWNTDPLKQP